MKKRIAFALAGILVCVGAAIWLIPYAPMPDMDGFWNVRIWRVNGADMTDSMAQAQAISCEMERQAKLLPRWDIIKESVANYGCAIVFDDLKDACRMADVVAPEHLEVVTAAPRELLPYLHNAGAIFLGQYAPEPLGDYMAGPCHVLPTSGTARFFSPLSTDTFLKKTSVIEYTRDALESYAQDIIALAQSEHLDAHANSIAVRFAEENDNENR